MKYPKLPHHLDRRKKLLPEEITEIRELSKTESQRELAKMFGVSKTTIRYYQLNEKDKAELNKKRYKRLVEVRLFDKEAEQKHRQAKIKAYIEGYKKFSKRAEYKGKETYKWKKKKYHSDEVFKEKVKQQAREAYYKAKSELSKEKEGK